MTAPASGETPGAVRDVPRRARLALLPLLGLLAVLLLALLLLGLLLASLFGGGGDRTASSPPSSPAPAAAVAAPAPALVGGGDVQPIPATGTFRLAGGLGTVLFASDATIVTPLGRQVVERAAAQIRRDRPGRVTVTGYTDRDGAKPQNSQLSRQRAEAVARALKVAVGPGPTVYRSAARGENDPIAANATAQGRQLNRRATITTG